MGSDVLRPDKGSSLRKLAVLYCMRVADIVTTTAIETREYVISTFDLSPDNVIRVPWGIDLEIFHRGYEKKSSTSKDL